MQGLTLTVCDADDEYAAWREVRLAVELGERSPTVAELRAQDSGDRLLLLAVADDTVVGSGIADRAESADAGFALPRVLPEHRRQGVGSALLRALADHCAGLGVGKVVSRVDEPLLPFASRFGFAEVDREVEQVRTVGDEPAPPPLSDDVEVVPLGDRPELWEASFETFGQQVLADFAVHTPLEISAEQWNTSWRGDPMFLAVHDGEVIGCAGLTLDTDQPQRAENALTAVRRDWRGRGVASHLKRRTLHWAATHGVGEVYTWTQIGNASMRRLNEHLGYVTSQTSITLSRALPL
ncbi:GNAT family N-acetyltransferase [Nocardioides sp.]|uniref:GNAT family N-acetyltransferase n=1 Tax=Nocardioides sp. TaxID=35761 RepID=UPI002D7F510A|nr:GNAT family N-acetyltransferase [Nocardioides sp.]HET8960000.1 GNAT family N-acetyltransferase [Nocardioides sp.]